MDKTGRSNGLYVDAKGNLLACADAENELWSINPTTKQVTVLLKSYQGKRFNGPNDLWVTPKSGIYFTDPLYPRDYWTHKMPELAGQHVYYLPKGTGQPRIADSTLVKPNGIVGSPDGKRSTSPMQGRAKPTATPSSPTAASPTGNSSPNRAPTA